MLSSTSLQKKIIDVSNPLELSMFPLILIKRPSRYNFPSKLEIVNPSSSNVIKPSSARKLLVLPLCCWEDKARLMSEILIEASVCANP